jgi:hypothetical protein
MIKNIGNEIQKLKVQNAIAQVTSDTNNPRAVLAIFEHVIHSAFNHKLAPGTLSIYVLDTIVNHIKDRVSANKFHNFIHHSSYFYKLETSFIHRPEEQTVILIIGDDISIKSSNVKININDVCNLISVSSKHFN